GHLILAALLALLTPWTLRKLDVPRSGLHRPQALFKLAFVVLADIIRSNIAVARIVAGKKTDKTSGFIDIPLTLRSHYGLALLAIIVTSTPGTLWVSFNQERGVLTLHILDLVDEEGWISLIQTRYESLLLEACE